MMKSLPTNYRWWSPPNAPDDLQETLLGKVDFSWLTDGSYSKGDNEKYFAGYATAAFLMLLL